MTVPTAVPTTVPTAAPTTATLAPGRRPAFLLLALLAAPLAPACAAEAGAVAVDPAEAGAGAGAGADGKADGATARPDVRCAGAPDAGPTVPWRHTTSGLIALAGANHRGFDLIAAASEDAQVLAGELAYSGVVDKSLGDEDVDLFACRAGAWRRVGSARTDAAGAFALTLTGARRLPVGLRDLYVSVRGDRSGARFVGLVAPAGAALVVSDVDGTLTSSENAYPLSLVTGADVAVHPGAPAALARLRARGYQPVYVTARGDRFTEGTRQWLAAVGLPRGPMRLAPHSVTLPGASTVAYKAGVFAGLVDAGFDLAVGIGNRASDVEAYAKVGVDAGAILIKLPEYAGELGDALAAGRAHGFERYGDLAPLIDRLPAR